MAKNEAKVLRIDEPRAGAAVVAKDTMAPRPANPFGADVGIVSQRLGSILRGVGERRKDCGLQADEVLIFLAIGFLTVQAADKVVMMKPTTYLEISRLLSIPKETVRRKAARLVKAELAYVTPQGVLVKDVERWRELAGVLTGMERA